MNTLTLQPYLDSFDSDSFIDQLIRENDESFMPLPDMETEPHLLISKVRKHYMGYIIKLLTVNYENSQKLLNKNIYLPSAIWRCAKVIERSAAQTCMIKELKNDTKKGKLSKKLYNCLVDPPQNEKNVQTSLSIQNDCNCQCACSQRKKRRKSFENPNIIKPIDKTIPLVTVDLDSPVAGSECIVKNNSHHVFQNQIPIHLDSPEVTKDSTVKNKSHQEFQNLIPNAKEIKSNNPSRLSIESQDSDELMMQLEKLFQCDSQEDDLFEGTFCEHIDTVLPDSSKRSGIESQIPMIQDSIIEDHAAQIKSLDERLASLAGMLNNENNISQPKDIIPKKNKKHFTSKWLCEEYYLKSQLFELFDEIGDCDRKKLARIKQTLAQLFGEDSDDEGVLSPLEETPEFIISCKERIAPWVVKLLTPFYIKGRIRGKALFKAVAKHLLRLIYQCSRYPHEYEVHSFVSDFLKNHKTIRCEADFKQFKIENYQ